MTFFKKEMFLNLSVFLVLLFTISVGMFYTSYHNTASLFWPASGVYLSLYYIHKKRFLYIILISIFITILTWRLYFQGEPVTYSISLALLFTLISYIEMLLFSFLIDFLKIKVDYLTRTTINIPFFIVSVLIGLLSGVLTTLSLMIFVSIEDFMDLFLRSGIGVFLGLLVFGTLSFSSHFHDNQPKFDRVTIIHIAFYLLTFIFNLYFIFGDSGNNFISFSNFQIIIFVYYILCAFAFSYRMISITNLIFLIMIQFLYLQYIPSQNFVYEAIIMTIYIMVLSSIASIVRNVLLERQNNFNQLKQAKVNLDNIIISTNKLLSIEDRTPNEVEQFSTNYFIDMFHLACDIYPKFEYAACYIRKDNTVHYIATYNFDLDFLNEVQFDANDFDWDLYKPVIQNHTAANSEIVLLPKFQEYKDRYGEIKSSIRFTIKMGENEIGGMSFDIPEGSHLEFDQNDLQNFESFQNLMNGYYSIGILNNQNETLKDDIVRSIVSTLELYDSYTESHSDEVSKLCMRMADELGLSSEQKRELYWSSLLHDIGKIGIHSDILNKPGRLTDVEYDLIKQHPVFGYEILSRSDTLANIAINVKHHHEWFNGSGYPDGLSNDHIPYLSQIIHICDAVSAMSHKRVYKDAMTQQEIIKEIKKYTGAQFNPKLADVMIEYIDSGKLEKLFTKIRKRD